MIRSRLHWLQQGEKPSRYFCNLENRNFVSKRMTYIENDDGNVLFDQDDLTRETKSFYKNLYEKRETEDIDLTQLIAEPTILSDTESQKLEGLITYNEAIEVLKKMKNNKSPGNSGFSNEFFKFFFIDVGIFLIRSINHGFITGKLSVTQRQGVITCLPKEGKNIQKLNNWRPISLLNVSYKIASACIAERLKTVLQKLIGNNQNGFMTNRFIGLNIRLMFDTLMYTDQAQIPGMLLLIDFYKAFDCVSWSFISKILDFFNFGDDFKKWIEVFYTEITSCVQVNGYYSEYFAIQRGVRQGDPLSPYLFLICAEILSYLINQNDLIKGIKIKDQEVCLSQFADDTALYLDGSQTSLKECIRMLNIFARLSGLKMNNEKTNIIWLGSKKNSEDRYMRDMNFTWDPGGPNNSKFRYLGIYFSTDIHNIINLNFNNKIQEIQKLFKIWNKRNLTPFGKITVVKTLAISKLTYLFTNLPDPNKEFIKNLDKLVFQFLWNGNHNKISKKHVCMNKEDGGLDMIDINDFIAKMKIGWMQRFVSNVNLKLIVTAMYPCLEKITVTGNVYLSNCTTQLQNPFWSDVLKHTKQFLDKCIPADFQQLVCERLFYNQNLSIHDQPIHFRSWIDCDVVQIHQILKINEDNVQFLSFHEFIEKYQNVRTTFLHYQSVIRLVTAYMRNLNIVFEKNVDVKEPIGWQYILSGSKQVIKDKLKTQPQEHNSVKKWNDKFDDLHWNDIYYKCFKTSKDTKLKWFQLRLLYRILPTNRYLKLMNIKEQDTCNFCGEHRETIEHLFWDCNIVTDFWKDLYDRFIKDLPHTQSLHLSKQLILFGVKSNVYTDKPFDLMILSAKFYIYSCRFVNTTPLSVIFMKQFKLRYKLEKMYNESTNDNKFQNEWAPYMQLLS